MAVHMRNGIQYGGIPNGTVKGTTPSTVPTTVKQLNQIGTVGDIAPVTIPSAVKFSNGNTLETAIGSVATIETSPAVATHAIGDYVFYNGQMYKVIAAIAVGETLTVDTNIEATSVGEELTSLNNGLIAFETTHESTLASGVGRTISQNAQYTQVTITEKGLYLLSAETSGMNINGRTYAFFTGNNVIPALSLYPATVNTEYYHKQIVQFVKVGNTPITVSLRYWDSNSIPEHKYKIYKILG